MQRTALHYAVRLRDMKMTKMLCTSFRANLDAREDENGFTPLADAVARGDIEMVGGLTLATRPRINTSLLAWQVTHLCKLGARPNIKDKQGNNPIHTAVLGMCGDDALLKNFEQVGVLPTARSLCWLSTIVRLYWCW